MQAYKSSKQCSSKIQPIGDILHKALSETFFHPINKSLWGHGTFYSYRTPTTVQVTHCNSSSQTWSSAEYPGVLVKLQFAGPHPESSWFIRLRWDTRISIYHVQSDADDAGDQGAQFKNHCFYRVSVSESASHYETRTTEEWTRCLAHTGYSLWYFWVKSCREAPAMLEKGPNGRQEGWTLWVVGNEWV